MLTKREEKALEYFYNKSDGNPRFFLAVIDERLSYKENIRIIKAHLKSFGKKPNLKVELLLKNGLREERKKKEKKKKRKGTIQHTPKFGGMEG